MATKQIRVSDQIPAVLYGKKIGSQPIAVDSQIFTKLLRDHGKNSLIKLSLETGTTH